MGRHRLWLALSLPCALAAPLLAGAGGRRAGLGLGIVAGLLLLLCGLFGLRRRLLWLPLRATASGALRAHLWLGGLCLVFALAHGRLRAGGPLSLCLTGVVALCVASGVLGVILQRALVRQMSALSTDTIFDLHQGVLSLRRRAYEIVWAATGAAPQAPGEAEALRRLLGAAPRPRGPLQAPGSLAGQEALGRFYHERLLPFVTRPDRSPLARATEASLAFELLEAQLAPALQPAVRDLRERCESLRAALRQHRIHRLIHGWLLAHVPLSMAALLLLLTHAVMALRY